MHTQANDPILEPEVPCRAGRTPPSLWRDYRRYQPRGGRIIPVDQVDALRILVVKAGMRREVGW